MDFTGTMLEGEDVPTSSFKGPKCSPPARVKLSFLVASGIMVLYMSRMNLLIAVDPMVQVTDKDYFSFMNTPLQEHNDVPVPYCSVVNGNDIWKNSSGEDASGRNMIYLPQSPANAEDFVTGPASFASENADNSTYKRKIIFLKGTQKAAILGAYYLGYFTSPIIGGRLADYYGTKRVFGTAVFVDTLVNLVTPMAVKSHYVFLVLLRLAMGMFQGACLPSLHSLMAKWIPPSERPRFLTFTYLAHFISMTLTHPFHTAIIGTLGWESVFYICSCISLPWILIWTCAMRDDPEKFRSITTNEKRYIFSTVQNAGTSYDKIDKVPWSRLATSSALLSLSLAHSANMLGFSVIVNQFPVYFRSILGITLSKHNSMFFIPALMIYVACNLWAWIDNCFARQGCIPKSIRKKLLVSIGFLCPASLFVAIGYIGCNKPLVIGLTALGVFLNGAAIVGYGDGHLHIAPNFAGTCFGFSETYAFPLATIAPTVAEYFTQNKGLDEWQMVFWVLFLIYCFCTMFFVLFGSFETLDWNRHSLSATRREEEMITKLTSHRSIDAYS